MVNRHYSKEPVSVFDKSLLEGGLIDFESLLRFQTTEEVAEILTEAASGEHDLMKKNALDRFLSFVHFKTATGNYEIVSMAYPARRMLDKELEKKVSDLINFHLYPEIIFYVLKFFMRNVSNPDMNLYLANLISSEEIIRSVFETYRLVRRDIFAPDREKRYLNVKRLQQFSKHSEDSLSSPLDAAARLKYILEFFAVKYNLRHIYTAEDLKLSGAIEA